MYKYIVYYKDVTDNCWYYLYTVRADFSSEACRQCESMVLVDTKLKARKVYL